MRTAKDRELTRENWRKHVEMAGVFGTMRETLQRMLEEIELSHWETDTSHSVIEGLSETAQGLIKERNAILKEHAT